VPRIDFGLWLDAGLPSQTLASRLEELAPLLAAAEEAGFDSVWVGEAWPRGPRQWHQQAPSLPLLAALVSLTRLRLGTGVLLLPAWAPLNLAYQAAALDQLSRGRLTLGVGSGTGSRGNGSGSGSTRPSPFSSRSGRAPPASPAGSSPPPARSRPFPSSREDPRCCSGAGWNGR